MMLLIKEAMPAMVAPIRTQNPIELIDQPQKNKRDTYLTKIDINLNQTFTHCEHQLEDSNKSGCTNGSAVEQAHFGLWQRKKLL